MFLTKNKKLLHLSLAAFMAVSALTSLGLIQHAQAAALSQVFVRFDRMKVSTGTTGTVCAKPTSVATEGKVVVTFPTGYALGLFGTFTVNTTNTSWPTGGTIWPGITAPASGADISGQAVTFGSTDLTVGTLYCFNWATAGAVTQPGSANPNELGTVATQTGALAAIDSGQYATATITDDQIVVNATIPPLFSFALSGNTDNLPALGTATISTSPTPRTATLNTNAKNGWMVWAKDANTGLNSATAAKTIASTTPGTVSTLTAGTEGYNTGVTSTLTSGAAITVDPAFIGAASKGGGLDTTLRPLATAAGVANNAVLTLTNNAAISGATPAAPDYTDTITVIGAGLF